jgi:V/A-type H+-transporting ATPase subunit A
MDAAKTYNDAAFEALDAGVPVEEITDIDAAPRLNRIGVQEDWDEYIDELEDDIESQLRELY